MGRQSVVAWVAITTMLGINGPARADIAGVAAGVALWNYTTDGQARSDGDAPFDLQDDLGLDSEWSGYAWIAIEHPVPLLPNIRLEYTPLGIQGSGTVSQSFAIGDITFSQGADVHAKADLDQYDLVLYYELLDNIVSLDAGLDIKYVDGRVQVRRDDTGERGAISFNTPLPLLYGAARVDLPATGLWLGGQISGLAIDGNKLVDLRATLGYDFLFGLGIQAGYRHQTIELDDINDSSTDLSVGGPFIGIHADF